MSIKVKFDVILGRLREKDGEGSTPPVTHSLSASITPGNQSYFADQSTSPGLTVTVTLEFDGTAVNADTVPNGWTKTPNTTGIYTRHIDDPGTINAQQWDYTYNGTVYHATSQARSLTAVYPAYWGIYPSNDASGDISSIVADICSQHRQTTNLNTTVEIPNPTGNDCWLWIVTHGTATAKPESFDISMVREPVTDKTFKSPLANWNLNGYKAYISINPADAGLSFGNVKLNINL